jgi:RNA-directed DNA polymerase
VSQGLKRVREVAKQRKKERFTALIDLLKDAYSCLKREAAPGVDGRTWQSYKQNLEANLVEVHSRIHRGRYRALPSRRRYIPKPDGRQRPLGIAALEDKIVQRAVVEVLNAIYEEDFLGFSYGFRPGRGQHDALDALAVGITRAKVNWIVDTDIAGFFDTVSHEWLMRFVEHRIGDRRINRLIRKWLKAGVMKEGELVSTETGTPQGAVASPLLANIYLHYVFDLWADRWRKRRARGQVIIVRYADDIILDFEHEGEARRFMADMRLRFPGIKIDSTPGLHELPLDKITAPTLIISTRDDLFNTLPAAEFAASKIPDAKLVVYDTGGHLLVGRQQEVRTAVQTFLAGAGLSPSRDAAAKAAPPQRQ